MREEEDSWELVITCAGLSGPVREVVVIRPDDEVGVEFRRDELSVHCLVLAFRGDTPVRPERLELQSERLQLLYSSGDLRITSKEGRAGPKINSRPEA